jgi:hypothetical protein
MEASRPAPLLGQHNDEVLSELLGYSREKIDDLRAWKVITLSRFPMVMEPGDSARGISSEI